ncbi:MAG: hypothetical protein NHB32_26975 [Fischerella sp. CENA71]|nr:hypothetical protein [Fischerella sp. CENA71]
MKSYSSLPEYNFNIVMETEKSTLVPLEEITFADFLKVDIRVWLLFPPKGSRSLVALASRRVECSVGVAARKG